MAVSIVNKIKKRMGKKEEGGGEDETGDGDTYISRMVQVWITD